ncbi:chorismate mutase [Bacteroidota bacterium]
MKINLNLTPMNTWLPGLDKPLVIAGPCSAESEEQVMNTANLIKNIEEVKVFRAGIWKPRTRPNSFEGIGVAGLKWLQRVQKETGLLTAVEVANAEHTKAALDHGVDILWIGARTTVNPFSVQEIADVLKGHDVPVLVKNPISPDLQLWVGALERINQAGITKLGAIHRGFSPIGESKYRNNPSWEIPIELKRLIPELPIVCDPSHIAGNRELIEPVSQKAYDLQMDGVMIETHIDPDKALSDAKQQITPKTLDLLLHRLVVRHADSENVDFAKHLAELRGKIDKLDSELLEILATRMKISEKIAAHKKANDVTILQVSRYEEIINDRMAQAAKLGLDEEFIKATYEAIHKQSIKRQESTMNAGA